jgi:hypothetical protein
MSAEQYIKDFSRYLRTGDLSIMQPYCIDSSQIKRLAVYRNGFYKGCVDALAANFPMCEKLLGNDDFRKIARLYVDRFPPEQGTLVGYGQQFPVFIDHFINHSEFEFVQAKQNTSNSYIHLADIAHLDYAWLMSLMSGDSNETLTIEFVTQLIEQDSEFTELNVKLNPSVLLQRVNEDAFSQWISLKTNNTDITLTESSTTGFIMLWRLQGAVQARLLSSAEVALMQALQGKGSSLGDAFDAAITVNEEFEVSDAFTACLQNELLEIQTN